MQEWTDKAKEILKDYLDNARVNLESSGADADEVIDDLRRHIEEEIITAKLEIVTKEYVEKVIANLKIAEPETMNCQTKSNSLPGKSDKFRWTKKSKSSTKFNTTYFVLAMIFGVALPAITIMVEVISGMCASAIFDPIPTYYHLILISFVPVGNLIICLAIKKERINNIRFINFINSCTIGISFFYSIIFLPIMPFAAIGILFMGFGFLPLSPLTSLIVALLLRKRLRNMLQPKKLTGCWQFVLAICLIFIMLELPKIITYTGVQMAAGEKQSTRINGIKLLRKAGNKDNLLRACYPRGQRVPDVSTLILNLIFKRVPAKEVRGIYYKVTGTPYNAVKPPGFVGFRGGARINANEFDFGQGGDEVSARIRGLSLKQSRIDSIVNPESATYYTEWIMEFKNDSRLQREARTQVTLPPNGVVSRLTLWIDGEEREAAYAGRAKVKEAYKKVVQRRRDPVLVTTCGPDQILVQCFPVPPNGGTMKIKIGITAPLVLESYTSGLLQLPNFTERNFNIKNGLDHSVWIESKERLLPVTNNSENIIEHPATNLYALRTKLTENLFESGFAVMAERLSDPKEILVDNFAGETNQIVLQKIKERNVVCPEKVVLIIDGSRRMKKNIETIKSVFKQFPKNIELTVLLASDNVIKLKSIDELNDACFVGGCDNIPALVEGWNVASEKTNSVVLWLHGTQPFELMDAENLIQNLERRPKNPEIYDFQFGGGPNKIAAKLNGLPQIKRLRSFGNSEAELKKLFDLWRGTKKQFYFDRELIPARNVDKINEDSHVARLWANEEVSKLANSWSGKDKIKAVEIASDYHLVTPVSGAVVLENTEQYIEAGLEPVDEATSPHVIPEPFLFINCYLLFIIYYCRRKFKFSKI
ncbi:hypothetical protein KAH27_04290 [bacterium]|nr:hypothetical protein [bacterium]